MYSTWELVDWVAAFASLDEEESGHFHIHMGTLGVGAGEGSSTHVHAVGKKCTAGMGAHLLASQ